MRGLLALSALAATVWVPTTGATLIVEHETWGPYVWDRYTSVERSHITVSYTDGVWVYTEPPFVHWFWSVSENGEGSLHNAVTLPSYKDRGDIFQVNVHSTSKPREGEAVEPIVWEKLGTGAVPVQEDCDGKPCPYSAAIYDSYQPRAFGFTRFPGDTDVREIVENGGAIEFITQYWIAPTYDPDAWFQNPPDMYGAVNSLTSTHWEAQYELESLVIIEVGYQPFAPIPEPGTATLFLMGAALVAGAYGLRRSKLGLTPPA